MDKFDDIIVVNADWDVNNAIWLTRKLYRSVVKEEIVFDVHSKKGSLMTEFVIAVGGGLGSIYLFELCKIIFNRLRREKDMGKQIKDIHIHIGRNTHDVYIITGNLETTRFPPGMDIRDHVNKRHNHKGLLK